MTMLNIGKLCYSLMCMTGAVLHEADPMYALAFTDDMFDASELDEIEARASQYKSEHAGEDDGHHEG